LWDRVPLVGRGPKPRQRGAPGTRCYAPRCDTGVAEPPLEANPPCWPPWRGGETSSDEEAFVERCLTGGEEQRSLSGAESVRVTGKLLWSGA
jgi:hypothetical protein